MTVYSISFNITLFYQNKIGQIMYLLDYDEKWWDVCRLTYRLSLLLFMSMKWDRVCELRPHTGLFFIPQTIYEYGVSRWHDIDTWNRRTLRKACPSATLSITNPTWSKQDPNTGLCFERPMTNHLSHGRRSLRLLFVRNNVQKQARTENFDRFLYEKF
jgi:hypothetical protein